MSNVKCICITGDIDTVALMGAPRLSDPIEVFVLDALRFTEEGEVGLRFPEVARAAGDVERLLASCTIPHFGLRVRFFGIVRQEQNKLGGLTSYWGYKIEGEEAVSFEWVDRMVASLKVFGKVWVVSCMDCEGV